MQKYDILLNEYSFNNIPKLTKEEEKSPYAKFYYLPIPEIPEDLIMAMAPDVEMDQKHYIEADQLDKLFTSEENLSTSGWMVNENGTGYFHIRAKLSDDKILRSPNPIIFGNDPVGYKAWCPGFHDYHTDVAIEDLGWGMLEVGFGEKYDPNNLPGGHFAMNNPKFENIRGDGHLMKLIDNPNDYVYSILLKFDENTSKGKYTHCVSWIGYDLVNGKSVYMESSSKNNIKKRIRLLGFHCIIEALRRHQLSIADI